MAKKIRYKYKEPINFPFDLMMEKIKDSSWKVRFLKDNQNSDKFVFKIPSFDSQTGKKTIDNEFIVYKSDLVNTISKLVASAKNVQDLISLLK